MLIFVSFFHHLLIYSFSQQRSFLIQRHINILMNHALFHLFISHIHLIFNVKSTPMMQIQSKDETFFLRQFEKIARKNGVIQASN